MSPELAVEDGDENATRGSVFRVLVSKADAHSKPVLFFPYPPLLQLERECPVGYEVHEITKDAGVRITYSFTKRYMYNAIRQSFKAAGLAKQTTGSRSNIFWGHHLKPNEYLSLYAHQKVNHFPGSFELGRKDRLCGNLLRMRKKHPDAYRHIIPETYLTANEYEKKQFFQQYLAQPSSLWILKPPNLSCGRGIKLVAASTTPTLKLSKKKAYVAQKYIANPFLINELKFDLRIYVVVTSYDPLRVYLYDDGLVRFCTEKYSTTKSGLKNHFGHLTNYSVNKRNTAAFQQNQDDENDEDSFHSSKWSLKMFYKFVADQGKNAELESFRVALEDLIVKTIISVENKILMMSTSGNSNGFELYGFDVILEGSELKPWLLEVNVFPSLSSSSPMDKRIKTILVSDLFQLIGIPFQDSCDATKQVEKDKRDRLLGMNRRKSIGSEKGKKKTIEQLLSSSIQDMDESELRIIKEMEEEEHRRGHFKRIFPTSESWDKYGEVFETLRYKNVLCMRWLQELAGRPRRRTSTSAHK